MTRGEAPTVPFIKADGLVPARADRLSDRVVRIVADNAGPFTYTGSGTYLVGDRTGVVAIDPGPDDPAHAAATVDAAPGPIIRILVTHTHRDHCGNSRRLSALTGAPVWGCAPHPLSEAGPAPALDEGADAGFAPDRDLSDGDLVTVPTASIRVLATPGHCANHLCYALEEEKALFTGDHVMGWATTVVAPPDGDMEAYLSSLERLRGRDDLIYYPTHGAPIPSPQAFVTALLRHRAWRDARILEAVAQSGPICPRDLVQLVYDDLPPALTIAAALTVEAHCIRQVSLGGLVRHANGRFGTRPRRP